ncbi:CU044_5270 family protein [Actinophytocola oryzae]|uniref:CU044_5270 family protein n=1 Tax=Actinophytocola oryzae TaxID=502181 RepID=A0A4V3FQR8_9PSEU|nr:CU044_5270 family protein [Actinophytocola oryzae]TDV40751.1 hypothetical protein CLV71_122141 [Actinophytocola oryzae]
MPDSDDNVRDMWSDDELDRALAALGAVKDPDRRVLTRSRTELLVAAGAANPEAAGPRRRWRWWAAAVASVVVVVASVLVVQTVRFGDNIPNAAGQQLTITAERITSVDQPLGPGEYRYVATHAWWLTGTDRYSYLAENLLETWVPADQTQDWLLRRDVTGARKWVSGTEAEARAAGYPVDEGGGLEGKWRAPCGDWFAKEEHREPCARRGTWQTPDEEFLASLPREPTELYDRLRAATAGQGPTPDLEVLVYVADALRSGLVPADLRAAFYRALALVPDLRITDRVANLDGREGTAYGVTGEGTRQEIIVDPATGQFIGERETAEQDGTVIGYTSVATAVVPAMGVRPPG